MRLNSREQFDQRLSEEPKCRPGAVRYRRRRRRRRQLGCCRQRSPELQNLPGPRALRERWRKWSLTLDPEYHCVSALAEHGLARLVTAETKAQPSSRKVNNSIHIIGSGERRLSGGIQTTPRRGRESRTGGLFVSRLAPSTSASALRRHIKDSCDVTVTCVSIKTKFDPYCSFRVFAERQIP